MMPNSINFSYLPEYPGTDSECQQNLGRQCLASNTLGRRTVSDVSHEFAAQNTESHSQCKCNICNMLKRVSEK